MRRVLKDGNWWLSIAQGNERERTTRSLPKGKGSPRRAQLTAEACEMRRQEPTTKRSRSAKRAGRDVEG